MGYPQHWLTQFGGTMGTAVGEIWSCGIRNVLTGTPGVGFDPDDGYLLSTVVPALAAWFIRPGSKISARAKLVYVKCNEIDEDGNYADSDSVREYFWPTPVAGVGAETGLPYQATVVLSWETNEVDRGLASKGRIFSPAPVVTSAANGLFAAADALAMATSAATLLNSLDDSVGVGQIRPHIVSRGRRIGEDSYGPGAAHQIDRVRVDNRIDTQRRRANQIQPVSSNVEISY